MDEEPDKFEHLAEIGVIAGKAEEDGTLGEGGRGGGREGGRED